MNLDYEKMLEYVKEALRENDLELQNSLTNTKKAIILFFVAQPGR